MMNCIVCELYLKKLVFKNIEEGKWPLRWNRKAMIKKKAQALLVLAAPQAKPAGHTGSVMAAPRA